MVNQIQSGTMMVYQLPDVKLLAVETEPYFGNWRSLGMVDSLALDHKVRAKGLSLFFMAGEITAVVPAWGGPNTLRRGVKRLLAQTRLQHLNCLEVTDIRRKYFLGIPYLSISANLRHIQAGARIQPTGQRAHDGSVETPLAD
jgi:hypothetical protein